MDSGELQPRWRFPVDFLPNEPQQISFNQFDMAPVSGHGFVFLQGLGIAHMHLAWRYKRKDHDALE